MRKPLQRRMYQGWVLEVEWVPGTTTRKYRGEARMGNRYLTARDCETETCMVETLENIVDSYLQGRKDQREDVLTTGLEAPVTITLRYGDEEDVLVLESIAKTNDDTTLTVMGVMDPGVLIYDGAVIEIPFTVGRTTDHLTMEALDG